MSSIHILYNHTPTARLRPHPELCCGFDIFNWTEVVHVQAGRSVDRSLDEFERVLALLKQAGAPGA